MKRATIPDARPEARQPREPERRLGPDGFEAWQRAVLLNPELTPTEKTVVLVVATHDWHNIGDGCTLAVPTLAQLVHACERTVQTTLRRLAARGLITVEARSDANGAPTSSRLRVNRRRCLALGTPPGATIAPPWGQELHHPGATVATTLVQPLHPKSWQLKPDTAKPDTVKPKHTPAAPGVCVPDDVRAAVDEKKIEAVFTHWRDEFGRNPARTHLTASRRALIAERLTENGGDVSELLCAVSAALEDDYLMGSNDRGKRFDGIETILRDRGQVERLCILAADRRESGGVPVVMTPGPLGGSA